MTNNLKEYQSIKSKREKVVEKYLVDGLDISPLIRMHNSLYNLLERAQEFEGELYLTHQEAAIHVFQVAFEISWKIMKKILQKSGMEVNYSKDTFRAAYFLNLINNPEVWIDFLKVRNEIVHSYDEDILRDIYRVLPDFVQELEILINNLKNFERKEALIKTISKTNE